MKRLNKRGVVSEYLPWILIAVAVLAILMIAIFILKDKGVSAIDALKNLFRS
jgi:Na+/melibiose symporter-like transporter